ncbi:MAG: GGDEF domain-containing protein [Acidobacteriota bacterium]|nr:GGDEF domain-containing protein [Acidobacteriota bacterium]
MSRRRVDAVADPAAQWRTGQPEAGARLSGRGALVEMMRAVHAPADPVGVAEAVIGRLAPSLPAPAWALVAADPSGRLATLAGRDLGNGLGRAAEAVAAWVVERGQEFVTADLRADPRVSDTTSATVVAFPLAGRDRMVGALVGLAGIASAQPPVMGRRLATAVATLLEPAAAALDAALQRERLEALSVTDDLTQLYNSRYLNLALRRETKRAARSGLPLSLLFIDLDGFKLVNDRYGHLCGSRTLVEVAAVIRTSARETDVAARFGGDEFAVVLPETHAAGALAVGERVRSRIEATRFLEDGPGIRVTASVGVATLPDVVDTAEGLVSAADAAMYAVKDAGKNGVLVARRGAEASEPPVGAPPPVSGRAAP